MSSSSKKPVDKKPIRDLLNEKDAFLTTSEKFYEFFLRHTKGLAITGAAVVAAIIGTALYINHQRDAEQEATLALEKALALAETGQPDLQAAAAALEAVRQQHQGRKAARMAAYSLVGIYSTQGQADQALPIAENLLATAKNAEISLRPLLLNNLGGLYEVKENYPKAAGSYEALAALPSLDPSLKQDALMSLGRVNEAAGKPEDAKKHYQALVTEFPQSFSAYLANSRLAAISGGPAAFPTTEIEPSWAAADPPAQPPASTEAEADADGEDASAAVEETRPSDNAFAPAE